MAKSKPLLYINRFTGNIIQVSMFQVATLNEDWSRIKFVKNKYGERVMRVELNGATVDISESKA